MREVLRRIFRVLFWPVAVALDPRLRQLQDEIRGRMDLLEDHVTTDVQVASEMSVVQRRLLGRLEERIEALEAALAAAGVADPAAER